MMRCLLALLAGLLVLLGSLGKAAEPGVPRVELCSFVALRGDRISLADLLPAAAPTELRQRSQHVDLGRSPQPGSLRVIARRQLEQFVAQAPGVQAALSIPEQVLVKRAGRRLSAREIAQAILGAPGPSSTIEDEALFEKNLQMQAPMFVTMDDPGLKLLGTEFDRLRRETRFRLWTSREPHLHPFYVLLGWHVAPPPLLQKGDSRSGKVEGAASLDEASLVQNSQPSLAASVPPATKKPALRPPTGSSEGKRADPIRPAVLTLPGRASTLVAEGRGLRLTTKVVPLERGVKGQQILVRSMDRRRVFMAEVVGTDFLRADF